MIGETTDPADIEGRLSAAVETKIAQRRGANYRNYDIRPESIRRFQVNGHPALTAIAQFDTGAKQQVIECVAWLYSPNAHVFLFAPTRSERAARLQLQFDRFLSSIRLP
jgi:hypothetical protein